jgi:transposase
MSESKSISGGAAPTAGAKPRRIYTEEFKQDAVRLVIERKNLSAVARDLGVPNSVLTRWKQAWLGVQGSPNLKAFPGKGNPRDEEMAKLQRENTRLKEDNEILKKAVGIFTGRPS